MLLKHTGRSFEKARGKEGEGARDEKGWEKRKEKAGPPQNCIDRAGRRQVHLSLLLASLSSLAEVDSATQ